MWSNGTANILHKVCELNDDSKPWYVTAIRYIRLWVAKNKMRWREQAWERATLLVYRSAGRWCHSAFGLTGTRPMLVSSHTDQMITDDSRSVYLLNKEIKGWKLPFSIPFGQNFNRKVDFGGLPVTSVKTVQFTGGCYTLRERSVVILQYYNPVAKKL